MDIRKFFIVMVCGFVGSVVLINAAERMWDARVEPDGQRDAFFDVGDAIPTVEEVASDDVDLADLFADIMDNNEQILAAAHDGDLKTLRNMLELDPELVHAADEEGNTPLHLAAQVGRKDVVSFLINTEGVDVGAANNAGETPRDLADAAGHNHISENLLKAELAALEIMPPLERSREYTSSDELPSSSSNVSKRRTRRYGISE